jgi:hypothetical protein
MPAHYADAEARRRTVLVAVLNNPFDLRRAAEEGWYRIPQRRAPRRIGADFLAFYLTAGCGQPDLAHHVTYLAPVRRYQLLARRELLPEESNHPRADEYYYRIEIGPLQCLDRPVPAASYRRLTFIHTTLDRLLAAADVVELFRQDDPFEQLWGALREHRLHPLKNRLVGEDVVDIALRARGGYVGINCVESEAGADPSASSAAGAGYALAREQQGALAQPWSRTPPSLQARLLPQGRWSLLALPTGGILQDMDGCLRRIGAALIELGGSLSEPRP